MTAIVASRRTLPLPGAAGLALVPVAAWVMAVAVLAGPMRPGPRPTSLALVTPAFTMLDVATGLALLITGTFAWLIGRRRLGLAAMAASGCWWGPDLIGWQAGPAFVQSIGLLLMVLCLPALAMVAGLAVRARPSGRVRLTLGLMAAAGLILVVGWVVTYDPTHDPYCWTGCHSNALGLLSDFRAARSLASVWLAGSAVLGIAVAGWSVVRFGRGSAQARRTSWPVLLAAALVGIAWAVAAGRQLAPRTLAQPDPASLGVFVAQAFAVVALAAGVGRTLLDERRVTAAVRRISEALSPLPGGGTLREGLARALGDPQLKLAFPLDDGSGFVGEDGVVLEQITPLPGAGLAVSMNGRQVAVIVHSDDRPTGVEVARELGDAVRLAADNERLLALVRHELLELRESRARIVASGDAERHRLERDLHDGAQQRVLGVLYELAVARDQSREGGDATTAVLTRLVTEAEAITDALRRLARGLHSTMLTESGLLAALEELALDAPLPVELRLPAQPLASGDAANAAVWHLATAVTDDAARRNADGVVIEVTTHGEELRVTLDIEASDTTPELDVTDLEDRIGAAGGTLDASAEHGRRRIEVVLPCV